MKATTRLTRSAVEMTCRAADDQGMRDGEADTVSEVATDNVDKATLLRDEISRGDATIARIDTKANVLLAITGPLATIGTAALSRVRLPLSSTVVLATAAAAFTIAVFLLVWTVRPRLRQSGFESYGAMNDAALASHFDKIAGNPLPWHRERLLALIHTGTRKFRLVRLATSFILVGFCLALIGGLLAM